MEIQGTTTTETNIPAWGSFGADSIIEGDAYNAEEKPATEGEPPAASTEDPAAPAADSETAKPKADEAAETASSEKPMAPLLVATAPADADEQLAGITKQKQDLANKFDDGELTSREYLDQVDALNKHERKIEGDLQKAQIASEMAQQQAHNAFLAEVANFTNNTPYKESEMAWNMLDSAVRKVSTVPENANLTGRQILEKAHQEVLKDPIMALAFNQQKPPVKQSDKPTHQSAPSKKPDAPITLAHVPAAESTEAGEGRFAVIDRIIDPDERAAAVAKMSPADRNAYLQGAS